MSRRAWQEHCDHVAGAAFDDVWERYGPSYMEDMRGRMADEAAEAQEWLQSLPPDQRHEELWWEARMSGPTA